MKIVIATPLYPPEIGGPASYAKLLEEGLPKKGIEVELVKFSDVRHLPKIVRHIAYFRRIYVALAGADAVLALDGVSVGLPACVGAWVRNKPLAVKIVGDYAWEQGRQRFGITETLDEFVKTKHVPFFVWFLRKVQSGVVGVASTVIVPSQYLKGIVTAWGIPTKKINIIYNAVSREKIGVVLNAVEDLQHPMMVSVSRLVPWKNIDGVIDAVAHLNKRNGGSPTSAVSLAVVGDGPERARLVARAEETLDRACIFTGALSHKDTLAVMQSADVFVLNSSYEGLSHVLIEALSLGVPIVATDAGGNSEVITDGENGLLVPVGDAEVFVGVLSRLLADEKLRTRLSIAAKHSAKHFSTDVMLDKTISILKTLTKV